MPQFITNHFIMGLQRQTELLLNKAVAQWQMMPEEQMCRKPSAEAWSATQCLLHLNSYGHYYLPAIENAIKHSTSQPKPKYQTGLLGGYFTKLMQPGENGKVKKMKAAKPHEPLQNKDAYAVVAEFIDQQEKMLALLEKAKMVNLEKTRIPISIAKFIRLQLGDVFAFMIAHNNRHVLQAEKALGWDSEKPLQILLQP